MIVGFFCIGPIVQRYSELEQPFLLQSMDTAIYQKDEKDGIVHILVIVYCFQKSVEWWTLHYGK